jgi:hypothetical protein
MTKNKGGRPMKHDLSDEKFLKAVQKVASFGATNEEIGQVFSISTSTLDNYNKDERFLGAIKKGKFLADTKVIKSLYKRACGYNVKETTKELKNVKVLDDNGELDEIVEEMKITKIVTKHVAADPTAIAYWLNNRRRDDWKQRQHVEGSVKIDKIKVEIVNSNDESDPGSDKEPGSSSES